MFKKRFVTFCCTLAGAAAALMLTGCAGMDSGKAEAIMSAVQDVQDAANHTMTVLTKGAAPAEEAEIITADAADTEETADSSDEQVTRGWYDYGYDYYGSLGYDTDGIVDFYLNNNSDYEIVYAYICPENYPDVAVDILPSTLGPGRSYEYRRLINSYYWDEGDWRIYLVDADGDTSAIYDVFNPWSLAYINVDWDPYAGGYICEFGYYETDQQGYYYYLEPGVG